MDNTIDHSNFRAFRYSNFNIYDLDKSFEFPDKDESDLFGHINIFVGENNTGKSRLMRLMAKMETHHIDLRHLVNENHISLSGTLELGIKCIQRFVDYSRRSKNQKVIGINIDFHQSILTELTYLMDVNRDIFSAYREFYNSFNLSRESIVVDTDKINFSSSYYNEDTQSYYEHLNDALLYEVQKLWGILDALPKENELNFCNIFIGTLRTLRIIDIEYHLSRNPKKLGDSDRELQTSKIDVDDVFERIYRDEYKFPAAPKTLVFTGMTIYRELIDYLLGLQEKREVIQKYQEFLSKNFFDGKPIVLMPAIDKGYVRIKIGDEHERVISELGDGLQTIIILTFLPFVKNEQHERAYVYMDEPEMFLHPGMQRKLLMALSTLNFCTFFMTTHSNHLLDITIDLPGVTIFNFQKSTSESFEGNPKVIVKKVDSDRSSCLELLGVRNSSVFLANSTLWVEGITDRWYLKAMLDSYIEATGQYAFKEDIHYAFVEYGGGCITHWSFLEEESDNDEDLREQIEVQYLCSKAMVIADHDNATGEKQKRQERLKELLKERFVLLEGKEIENALDDTVIRQTLADFEKIDIAQIPTMSRDDYKNTGLGTYISGLPWNAGPKNKYAGDSGTLSNYWKMKFCRKACDHIDYNNLPEDTQELVKNIYDFIAAQNPH